MILKRFRMSGTAKLSTHVFLHVVGISPEEKHGAFYNTPAPHPVDAQIHKTMESLEKTMVSKAKRKRDAEISAAQPLREYNRRTNSKQPGPRFVERHVGLNNRGRGYQTFTVLQPKASQAEWKLQRTAKQENRPTGLCSLELNASVWIPNCSLVTYPAKTKEISLPSSAFQFERGRTSP